MLNFFIGFAFFEAGAFFGFFVAALLNAAHAGQEISIKFEEDDNGTERRIRMAENTLSVLKIAPGQYPQQVEIDNNLKALQEAVGGTIAAVYPFADPVAIICNDDGKLMGLPLNRALRDENGEMYDAIAGDFLVVGLGEEDFASLTPELAQKYEQLFHQPEAFLKLGNRLLVLPVPDEPPAEKPRTKPPAEHDR